MSKFAYAALVGAAMSLVVPASALSQDAAITAGGDITADEATPLPPIVVESPAEPARGKRGKKAGGSAAGAPAAAAATGEDAQGGGEAVGIFTLGQLDMIGGSSITNEAMWTFNKDRLDQALSIIPGVTMQTLGGSRNERDLFVRGFDRFRVPLYLDGVRIYLPADNRLDLNRFLTPDLAEIQVQKGYVSVLDGPGGMGGAINMVSRKPTKAVEIEGRTGVTLDGDLDSMGDWNAYAFAGTRQKGYYAQLSGNIVDRDHWPLSDDFVPSLVVNEDGGDRDHSEIKDWRVNAKVGITPNATDEYSINYTTQSGEKSAPLHVDGQAVQGRFWTWPYWDTQSVSWLSKTQIGSASYVKTNVYYNTFENLLSSFDNITYTTQSASGRTFNSNYDDYAYGGFVEAGTNLIPMNTFKAAVHYRRDSHSERSDVAPDGASPVHEPWQESIVDTWSIAAENTFHASRDLDFVAGVSYDMDFVRKAEEFSGGSFVFNEEPHTNAWNGQGAAIYRYSETGKVHASVSSRTRFPTLFDRYSTRFDTRVANPDIQPERATNYELGWSDLVAKGFSVSTALFYSDLKDSIQNVFVAASGSSSILGINADGEHYGLELSAEWTVKRGLRVGGNYTYLERNLDFAGAAAALPASVSASRRAAVAAADEEGTPRHEAFLYVSWDATERLTLTPSLELASDRSSLITGPDTTLTGSPPYPSYARIGSYALLSFQAEYAVSDNVTASVGGANLLDENYELTEGFPEPGRTFYGNLRARF